MFKVLILTIKRNFMNIPMIISIVCFSMLMIFILGNAIEGMQTSGGAFLEHVAYLNEDDSMVGQAFDDMMHSDDLGTFIEVTTVSSTQEGQALVENGGHQTFVSIKNNHISLFTISEMSPLVSVLEAFTTTTNYYYEATLLGETVTEYEDDVLIRDMLSYGMPVGIDYYAVQTLLQTLVFGGLFGMFSVLEDKEKNLHVRYMTAPLARWKVMVAKIIANTLFLSLLGGSVVMASSLMYDANWGNQYWLIALAILLHCLIITGIGMLGASITNSASITTGIILLLLTVFSKVAGAFTPVPEASPISILSPNAHAKNVIFGSIYGGSSQLIITGIIGLMLLAVLLFIAYFVFDWRKHHVYIQE